MVKNRKGRAAYGLETTHERGGKKKKERDWTGGGDRQSSSLEKVRKKGAKISGEIG